MADYVRIAGTDIYLRVFEQGDFSYISGTAKGHTTVDDLDLARDFADARAVCGSDTLPTDKFYFTFEGQKTMLNNQAVWRSGNYPVIWGMWGASKAETIYLAMLRGGFKPSSSNAMNYYLPVVTSDGVLFETTNQSTAYMPVSELTVYDGNPNFAPPHEHVYGSVVTAPTCTEQGYTTYLCDCGDNYVDNITEPTGHKYGDWVLTKLPTIFESGEETHTCASCGISETRSVNKLVLNVEPNSFMMGYRMGKMMLRRLLSNESVAPTPTATHYLYGHVASADETPDVIIDGVGYVGAVLPTVPTWDSKQYPYAFIDYNAEHNIQWFYATTHAPMVIDGYIQATTTGKFLCSIRNEATGFVWDAFRETDCYAETAFGLADNCIWANFNIMVVGGSTYLPATEPIPVYE